MIIDRVSYRNYVTRDLLAYGLQKKSCSYYWRLPALRFILRMRKIEYLTNTQSFVLIRNLRLIYHKTLNHCLATRLGFSIPINIFGPGLCIVHYGTIVVSCKARVGANCRLHPMTCIGDYNGAPILGDDVYIGPGAKLFGPITIGDNVAIGANSVVNKSFSSNVTIAGIPAHVVNSIGAREQDLFPFINKE